MPNHCENDLRIQGPSRKEVDDFFAKVRSEKCLIDANQIIPYPKDFAEMDKVAEEYRRKHGFAGQPQDGDNNGGYEWCIKNWGTKWGFYEFSEPRHLKRSSVVSFSTAWAPALPLIIKMSQLFPKLTFTLRYYECGMGFKGVFKVKAGVELLNVDGDYSGTRGG